MRHEPPVVSLPTLDADGYGVADGVGGATERVLPCAVEALRAGALVVVGPGLPPGVGRVRVYRWNGPAWFRRHDGSEEWTGRGEWYASAYVPGWPQGGGTVNVYLGKWRTPGSRARVSANAKRGTPGPLSARGVRRAVARIAAKVGGQPLPP